MRLTNRIIFGIFVISLLGSATLAYGLSTEFLFEITIAGGTPFGTIANSTHILVTDLSSRTIQIFDLSGSSAPPSIDTSPGFPRGITINSTHILVTDNVGIQVFNLDGTGGVTIAATPLTTPLGLAINSTNIIVADEGSDEIIVLTLSGNQVTTFGSSVLIDPRDVVIDSNGRIIVADSGHNQITIFDSLGNLLTRFGNSTLSAPRGVAVDSIDRIIVSDSGNDRIVVFDSAGNVLTSFGSTGAADGQFNLPQMLAVDSNDRIIVPDSANGDVQVFAYASEGGGGSDSTHKTAPTSGLDWTTHRQIVTDGFRVNDFKVTLDNNWWTNFPEKQIIVGMPNEFEIKTFAQNGGLMIQELCFGLDEVGLINTAEVCLEAWYDYQQNIVDVKVIQDTNVINEDLLKVSTSEKYCDVDGMKCTATLFSDVVFMEHLKNKVMAIQSVDQSRRTMMPTSLNDGIVIFDDSLNPMLTRQIAGTGHEGLITVTQVEKYSDLWIAEDGRIYEMFGISDSFRLVNQSYEKDDDTGNVKNRTHSAYSDLVIWQQNLATEYFDSSLIQKSDKGFIPSAIDIDGIDHRTETMQKLNWH